MASFVLLEVVRVAILDGRETLHPVLLAKVFATFGAVYLCPMLGPWGATEPKDSKGHIGPVPNLIKDRTKIKLPLVKQFKYPHK